MAPTAAPDDDLAAMFREEMTEALEELSAIVERIAARPGDLPEAERDAAFRVLHNIKGAARVVGNERVEAIAHALEDTLVDPQTSTAMAARLREGMGLVASNLGSLPAPAPTSPIPTEEQAQAAEDPTRERSHGLTVRVEASRLDALMRFAGEIMTTEVQNHTRHQELEGLLTEVSQLLPVTAGELGARLGAFLEAHRRDVQHFSYFARDWTTAIKRARLLPLAGVVAVWRRTVAEVAYATGRQVQLVADVGDIEVDRQILDGLRDPIMHILRNAVDHGIEPPEEREGQGKPRMGRVLVRAIASGMMIEIEVSDDGRGIDPGRITRRAVERGLISAEEATNKSTAEIQELLFRPGFSTSESVHAVSGRGVGLDIVKQRVEALGGQVTIIKPAFGGTTFRLVVPANVVSTKGLLVFVGRSAFVLPMAYVARTFRVPAAEVQTLHGTAAMKDVLGEPLRLRWLSAFAEEPRRAPAEKLLVVEVSNGTSRLGLLVDEVEGEVEAVTKRLPWNVPRIPGIAGVMILGTGKVAMVLDVPRLLGSGAVWMREQRAAGASISPASRKRRILVADDSLTSRTLERDILRAAGYEVDTANDGEKAWIALQEGVYDLLVSDVQMPGLDGVALTQRVRAHSRLRSLPVVLVTSLDRPEDLARGTAAGANEYIVKGRFDQRQLLEAVSRLL